MSIEAPQLAGKETATHSNSPILAARKLQLPGHSRSNSREDSPGTVARDHHHSAHHAEHTKASHNKGLALLVLGILGTQFPDSLDKEYVKLLFYFDFILFIILILYYLFFVFLYFYFIFINFYFIYYYLTFFYGYFI